MLQLGQRKQPVTVPLSDILSCDYARGDSGEGSKVRRTAQNGQKECDDYVPQKSKIIWKNIPEQYELLRYVVAGADHGR